MGKPKANGTVSEGGARKRHEAVFQTEIELYMEALIALVEHRCTVALSFLFVAKGFFWGPGNVDTSSLI